MSIGETNGYANLEKGQRLDEELGKCATKKSTVDSAFAELRETIARFEGVVDNHIDHLSPVSLMVVKNTKEDVPEKECVPSCNVVAEIREHSRNLNNISRRLGDATEALEI